jgi:predicted unusual protein kinase regulating ubiquinone biosynthesis (AarF/ABC1/UbiB family)
MTTNTVTIDVPNRLYRQLTRVAEQTQQDIAKVLLTLAETMFTVEAVNRNLPSHIADELMAMQWFSDIALWKASQPTLSEKQQLELSELTHQQANRPLTQTEQTRLTELLAEYDWSVLRRAQALALLSLRGHNIPDLNSP